MWMVCTRCASLIITCHNGATKVRSTLEIIAMIYHDLSILQSSTSLKWQNRWHRTFIYQRVSLTGPWLSSCWAIKKFNSSTYQTILVVNELVSSGNMKTIPSGQPAWQQKIDFSNDFTIRNIEVYVIHIHMIYWHDNITLLSIHYWRMRYKIPIYQLLPTFWAHKKNGGHESPLVFQVT